MAYTTLSEVKSIKAVWGSLGVGTGQYSDLELSALIVESDALLDNALSPYYTTPLVGSLPAVIGQIAKQRAAYMLVQNTFGNSDSLTRFEYLKTDSDKLLADIINGLPALGTNNPNIGATLIIDNPDRYFGMGSC